MNILIGVATFILILVALCLIMVVLAQKAQSDGGMGAAMGGGMAEAAFGAETGNVLTKTTINLSVAFFVLSFLVYLGNVYEHKHGTHGGASLPTLSGSTLPAMPASTAPAPAAANSAAPVTSGPAPATAPAQNPPAVPANK